MRHRRGGFLRRCLDSAQADEKLQGGGSLGYSTPFATMGKSVPLSCVVSKYRINQERLAYRQEPIDPESLS